MSGLAAKNEDLKISSLFDVSGFAAVVTGGGTGIGLMITQGLVANGARVYITGRREDALKAVVDRYNTGPGKIIGLPADVTSKDDIQKLVSQVSESEPKGIQLLVNNAGIARDDATKYANSKPDLKDAKAISEHLWKVGPESWSDTFATNVTALYFVGAAFLPLLDQGLKNTPGFSPSIINITSISGVMKGGSMGQFSYASSKAAAIHLTRMMASTFAETKIRVNSIAPGIFPSEMTAGSSNEQQKSELGDMPISYPAGRPGSDADMAACVLWLAGPGGVFMNGQIVYLDGGNTLVKPAAV
ncbi:MAG: hypothetical protein M1815_000162 [Lichina confinis]|nr:MAG: hypothetical protein M1815_000162 [Lichina confinis]